MTGLSQVNRAVNACHAAGIPVVGLHDCTCGLRGRLVVIARARDVWRSCGRTSDPARSTASGQRHRLLEKRRYLPSSRCTLVWRPFARTCLRACVDSPAGRVDRAM
jgi:hypothetical protein